MTGDKWKRGAADKPSPWKKSITPRQERVPMPAAAGESAPVQAADDGRVVRPVGEMRLYGLNACMAAFEARPNDLRKVYLTESRLERLKPVMAWCVKNRLGYRVVETPDLDKLSGSRHHEGVCFEMRRPAPVMLDALLGDRSDAASLLVWLDGVGNPHNLGALLRSATHFDVTGVIVPATSSLDLSGAAARVAEGGAEFVPIARIDDERDALARLRAAGYTIAASVPSTGESLFDVKLPKRLVLVFGAEGEGMSGALITAADLRLTIPGSGRVESLNIAASAAVFLAEYRRQICAR